MNVQATLSKLEEMKLFGMSRAYKENMAAGAYKSFTLDETLSHLIDAEYDERYNRKLKRFIYNAKFRYQASFEEIDFSSNRNLDKNNLLRLSDCNWISKGQNLLITGPTGSGKSFIASALGNRACMHGLKTLYYNCGKLFNHLKYAKANGTYIQSSGSRGF